jgi:hypothetical protein
MTGHHSPTGRGTKGYVAFELPDKGLPEARLCFLKDYWRPVKPGFHTELETYERLREHKVSHVATAIAGGDVIDAMQQEEFTVTQEKRQTESDPPLKRRHCRIVTEEIGRPLETFKNFTEFLWCVFHALTGTSFVLSKF